MVFVNGRGQPNDGDVAKLVARGNGIVVQRDRAGDEARKGVVGEDAEDILLHLVLDKEHALRHVRDEQPRAHRLNVHNHIGYLLKSARRTSTNDLPNQKFQQK